jgi:hypothetical protein
MRESVNLPSQPADQVQAGLGRFVLVVCDEGFRRPFPDKQEPGKKMEASSSGRRAGEVRDSKRRGFKVSTQ